MTGEVTVEDPCSESPHSPLCISQGRPQEPLPCGLTLQFCVGQRIQDTPSIGQGFEDPHHRSADPNSPPQSGSSSHSRPSRTRTACLLPILMRSAPCSPTAFTHSIRAGRAPGPLSPPVITHTRCPNFRKSFGGVIGPNNGSMETPCTTAVWLALACRTNRHLPPRCTSEAPESLHAVG